MIFQEFRKEIEITFTCDGGGSLLKRDACDKQRKRATHAGGSFSGALVCRIAHCRNGGRGGENSGVSNNFALLVLGDSRKPPEYG